MSQIGKKIINVPSDINIDLQDNLLIASKGDKKLSCDLHSQLKVTFEDSVIKVDRVNDEKKSRELHGLVRSLINNMIIIKKKKRN